MEDIILREWKSAIRTAAFFDDHILTNKKLSAIFFDAILNGKQHLLLENVELIHSHMNETNLTIQQLVDSLFRLRDRLLILASQKRFENLLNYEQLNANLQQIIYSLPNIVKKAGISQNDPQETSSILSLMLKALESIGEGILIIEPRVNGKILFVNKALENITGFSSEELLGKSLFTLFGIYHTPELEKDIFPAAIYHGWKGEVTQQGANLLPISIHMDIKPVRDEHDELLALVGIIRNITREKRHRLEMALREDQITRQNARLSFLEDLSAIVNATLDIRETLIGFSRKFQRIIPFQSLSFFIPVFPKDGIYRLIYECEANNSGRFSNEKLIRFEPTMEFNNSHSIYFVQTLQHDHEQNYFKQLKSKGVRDLICFPIHFKDEILGILSVSFSNFKAIKQEDIQFIEQIINHLTVALKNGMQFDQLERQNRKLHLFYNLFSYIKNNASANFILNEALIDMAISFSYDHLAIYQKHNGVEWQRIAKHSVQGICEKLFPEKLPVNFKLPKSPFFYVNDDEVPPFIQSFSEEIKQLNPTTFLAIEDATSIHGDVMLMGVCKQMLPDLSYVSHLELMRSILKELTLALDHNQLFQQTIQAEQEWKMTFDEVQIGLVVVDAEFKSRRVNKTFWQIFNKENHRSSFDLSEFFDISSYKIAVHSNPDTNQQHNNVDWVDVGTGKSLIRQFFPLFNRSEHFIGGIFTIQDVTQDREREARIRYLSRFPEVDPNIVLSLDKAGNIIYANNTAKQLTHNLKLKKVKQLLPVTLLFELQSNSFPIGIAQEYLHNLEDQVFQFTVFAPEEEDSIYLSGIDITERLQLQDKLILTERIRTIGELASGAAHDFNNYLMTILGRTQLLQMNIKQKFLREDLDVIEKAAKDGAEMVRKLQELNHRQDTREAKPLYLKDLINDSLMFSQQKIKAKTQIKGQETIITTNMDPSLVVSGNPAEFREIFTNLIFNAFDAMPDGGELKIETWREPKTHEAIVIIQDTGCGMPPEVRKKIFDPFFTTKGRNGTGLGLSVVYRITTSLRGDIEVESEVGVGTKFILYLPISTEIPDQEHKPVIAISPKIKTSSSIKLLVVDDEIDLLKTIVEVLKLKFDRVDMATSGKEALDKIGECDYDVVLTDLGMPEMSGWEVAEKVKGLLPASKVILVTGWGMHAEDELINHEAYVDTILSKPYDLHQLLMIIEQVFSDDQGASVGD